jgi:hypothetical protein
MATIKKFQASGAVAANTIVKLDGNSQTENATDVDEVAVLGVQLNATTTAGDTAYVCVQGECLVTAGEAVTPNEEIRPGAGGKAFGSDTPGDVAIGVYYGELSDGSYTTVGVNDLITVFLHDNKAYVRPSE